MSLKRIVTGDRPTGALHIGHYVGSLKNRVKLQEEYECFFIIADYQVLTDHLRDFKKIPLNIREIVLDYLSVGMDPDKSSFFIQSSIPEIAELTMYFSMLVTMARLRRNPTIKEEMHASKISEEKMSYGFFGYPISQAADILALRANLIPVGEDQKAHVEQTREIARKFNNTFGEVFDAPDVLLSEFSRLPGLDGDKMSKSRGNMIFLKDESHIVEKKIMEAYTDPTRKHSTDPGHVEGNVVFEYLKAFCSDNGEIEEWKQKYENGKIGDVVLKKRVAEIINETLDPIREKRKQVESDPMIVESALEKGIAKTRQEAAHTISLVKDAIGFNYKDLLG